MQLVIGGTIIPIYALAFLAVIGSVVFDSLAWRALLNSLVGPTNFWRVFELTWVGQFLDTLVPGGWAGDLFKTYLLIKEDGVNAAKATAAIIIKDALEVFAFLGSVIVGLVLLLSFYSISGGLVAAVAITLLFLSIPIFLVIYLAMNLRATTKLMNMVYKLVSKIKGEETGKALQEKLKGQIEEFHDGIASMRTNPKIMIKPAFYEIMAVLFDVLVLLFVFYALGTLIGLDKVLIANTIIYSIQRQGVLLAGFSQVVTSSLYNALGIEPVLSTASSLLSGFVGFWFRLVVAFGYFQLVAAEKCVPFFCRKCGGWRSARKKSCDDPTPKNKK